MKDKDTKISLLYEASKIIGSVFSLESLFKMIIRLITETMKVKICSVMLVDEETGDLRISDAVGLNHEIIKTARIKKGDGISGWVLKEGKSLLISDIGKDGRFTHRCKERYLTNSLLSVPLKINDKTIGVLNVNNKADGNSFNDEDRKLLELLASQIAVIIENAKLNDNLNKAKSDTKKAQEQLVRSEKYAVIGKLAAGLSHEINNPLTSIYGRIQQLIKSSKDEEFSRVLAMIKVEVERIIRILGNLLNFSRKTETKLEFVDLNEVIENSVNLLGVELKRKNISLFVDYDKKLPMILIDGDQLMQVVINIILNAMKAMPSGGSLTIATKIISRQSSVVDEENLSTEGSFYEISFADTGAGIRHENINHIFEPFYTNWTDSMGTGLGLSVSKDIIEHFGGNITVDSNIGKGTTFIITFPVKNANL